MVNSQTYRKVTYASILRETLELQFYDQAWHSQSNLSRDRAQSQNFNLGLIPQFYCYCTIIVSACETWNVSHADTFKVQWQ